MEDRQVRMGGAYPHGVTVKSGTGADRLAAELDCFGGNQTIHAHLLHRSTTDFPFHVESAEVQLDRYVIGG
jgi:hypothetical protein